MSSILVIEDEKGILGLIEAALAHHGHSVETAEDGRAGVQKFDYGSFDMVITDFLMPQLDGHGVVQHIRSSPRHRTPIIGMSGTPWHLEGADCDAILLKPFPLQKLVDSVKNLASVFASAGQAA